MTKIVAPEYEMRRMFHLSSDRYKNSVWDNRKIIFSIAILLSTLFDFSYFLCFVSRSDLSVGRLLPRIISWLSLNSFLLVETVIDRYSWLSLNSFLFAKTGIDRYNLA